MAKAPYVAQFVRALLDADERVLLFAHHHQAVSYTHLDVYKRQATIRMKKPKARKRSGLMERL